MLLLLIQLATVLLAATSTAAQNSSDAPTSYVLSLTPGPTPAKTWLSSPLFNTEPTITATQPWRTPGAHKVPGTRITFPSTGDYWVMNGTGVVQWSWDGAYNNNGSKADHYIRLAHINTSTEAGKWSLVAAWNVRLQAGVPARKGVAYAELGHPFLKVFPKFNKTIRPLPRTGYYLIWSQGGDDENSTVAISDVFEVKPAGTAEKLPKGWEKGFNEAAYNATEKGGRSEAYTTTRYTPPSSPTSTLPPWERPRAHNVPGTRITFPAAGDYWVADGTGVVGWQWNGAYNHTKQWDGTAAKQPTYWLYLAHVNVTGQSLTRYTLMAVWNARIPANVPGSKAFVYAQLGHPFIPGPISPCVLFSLGRSLTQRNYHPPPRFGYYISWELSQGAGSSPDSTIAVSEVFEIKEAGTKEQLPKGWQKGYGPKDFQKWNATVANGGSSGAGALTAPLALVVLGVATTLVL
ncbi:uncharacterized protein LOC62_02G002157 [Vanrija pseudolonga]|uniref:Uncharacterized protein n=1 Tax=Vanrija pseudolonga TaxID=143232 RepID=A0AAF1BNX8_9TREE|nr:hypothetical protein LOC62_02G002157 [Vanrija pseudolonga]